MNARPEHQIGDTQNWNSPSVLGLLEAPCIQYAVLHLHACCHLTQFRHQLKAAPARCNVHGGMTHLRFFDHQSEVLELKLIVVLPI